MATLPVVAGTLQTDPRSGGLKRSSGVNVLPSVAEAWAEVRDDSNGSVDWIIVGYNGTSKTDITVLTKGNGGVDSCSRALPRGRAVFGGCRLESGRFVTFFHADEETPTMQKGRASMHKNGVLNVLEGSDGEIEIKKKEDLSEELTSVTDNPGAEPEQKEAENRQVGQVESAQQSEAPASVKTMISSEGTVVVSYEVLKSISDASKLPPGVDPLSREQSLSDDEFVKVFGMDKDAFNSLPGWKRTKLKKNTGLF